MVRNGVRPALAGLLVLALLLGGCSDRVDKSGGDKAPDTLVLTGINNRTLEEVRPFDEQVEAMSGGLLSFEWDNGWHQDSATGPTEAIQSVRTGAADFAVIPARAWHAAGVTSFDALIAPMSLDSYSLQEAVLQDPMVDQMLAGVDAVGLTGIGILPGPLRKLGGLSRDLLAPSDLTGARIAMSPGGVPERSLRELGAVPAPASFEGEDISGADGLEGQIGLIAGSTYDDVVKEIAANLNLWPRLFVIVGNPAAVARLSDQQLQILRAAAKAAVPATTAVQHKVDAEGLQAICARGRMAFVPETAAQIRQWRLAFTPVYDWLATTPQTADFLARIEQLRTSPGIVADPIPNCPLPGPESPTTGASGSPTTAGPDIEGVYQMTTTMQDAVDMGMPIDENIQANIGTFTWTFDHGHLIETQSNGPTETWSDATYEVAERTLTIRYLRGGGQGPDSSAQRKRGEVDVWTWSLYRDQLTLHWKADPTADPATYPSNYAVKPWMRIAEAAPSTAPR